jgi:small subunit ribosomal protein S8e
MSKTTAPTLRKKGGGIKGKFRDKRKSALIAPSPLLQVGDNRMERLGTRGGTQRVRLLRTKFGNLYDPTSKKTSKVELFRVVENKANRTFARQNVITKGSIVETSEGQAIVVNRPGSDGQVSLAKVSKQ